MTWTELSTIYTSSWDNGYFKSFGISMLYFLVGAFWRYAYGKWWWTGAALLTAIWLLTPLLVELMMPRAKQGEVPTKAPTIYIHNFKLET